MKSKIKFSAQIILLSACLVTFSFSQDGHSHNEESSKKESETPLEGSSMLYAQRARFQQMFLDLLNSISIIRSGVSVKNMEEPQDKTGVFDESYWDDAVYL